MARGVSLSTTMEPRGYIQDEELVKYIILSAGPKKVLDALCTTINLLDAFSYATTKK